MRLRALLVVLAVSVLLAAPVAAQERPYENESNETGWDDWTEGHEDPTMANATHYVSRVGSFFVGEDPDDPGLGPILVGIISGLYVLTLLGQNKAGVIASGTSGVIVIAALSAAGGAGLMPRWVYGVVMMAVSLVLAVMFVRLTE